ncbi:hypothetical protein F0U44_13850 [Nocardioides humilatus]|uniref:Antibiotic biosynthesis monooxygenase n=1 Tax=Nocardioides humilatus TaxID=2607660 RepID=A0A5B1LGI5_9ACTN|nr:hypothetical protein [Nocardioides humilatus]KAA1419506.1 hypothetical protein F0U44_13850 [Nocardioides humilatus]
MSVLVTVKVAADVELFQKSLDARGDEFVAISQRGKAAGAIHHEFGVGPDYVLVIDEWDTAENFEAFFTSPELQAFIPTIGGDTSVPPEITFATALDSLDKF